MSEFHLPERLVTLPMSGGMEGAEIVCNVACPLHVWRQIVELSAKGNGPEIDALFLLWGLRAWNLLDLEGPVALEQFTDIDPLTRYAIVKAWLDVGTGVAAPLAVPSDASKPSAAPSTPKPAKPSRRHPS